MDIIKQNPSTSGKEKLAGTLVPRVKQGDSLLSFGGSVLPSRLRGRFLWGFREGELQEMRSSWARSFLLLPGTCSLCCKPHTSFSKEERGDQTMHGTWPCSFQLYELQHPLPLGRSVWLGFTASPFSVPAWKSPPYHAHSFKKWITASVTVCDCGLRWITSHLVPQTEG